MFKVYHNYTNILITYLMTIVFSSLIHKSDFHGAIIKVVRSKCSTMVGHKGIVILDTKGTFNIIGKDNVLKSKFHRDFFI